MKRTPLEAAAGPHFIGCWDLEGDGRDGGQEGGLCDGLIAYFERNAAVHKPGFVGDGVVDESYKRSLDLTLPPMELAKPETRVLHYYFDALNRCFWDYLDQWAFLKSVLDGVHIGNFNIQKYGEGDHFGGLHSERTALSNAHRVLVWMTYLNDVAAGGETEFPHFALKVRPARGKTLIWPAEWTHAHRGCVVERGPKYIVTGWMHFAK